MLDSHLTFLKDLVLIQSDGGVASFLRYIKDQTEICELNLIRRFYMLRNTREVRGQVDLLNAKYGTALDVDYFAARWSKFYSAEQTTNFDNAVKNLILKRDGNRCQYCNYKKKLEIHHVIPQEMDGSNSVYNLVAACVPCNRSISANIRLPRNWWILHPESRNV